jgi:DtxR family Mn-dependent transcriptional regulator
MITQQVEEYLEAIGRLEERGEEVTTSAIARECQVAPPSVTEMLQRLSDRGFVSYESRRGASLTEEGRGVATSVLRRHRLWERFLHDVLGFQWDEVHDQACGLEHATSPDLERRLAQLLGYSHTCPHGNLIPGMARRPEGRTVALLSELEPAQFARIVSVRTEEPKLLRRLGELGLRPGAVVQVEGSAPEGGPLALQVGGRRRHLERDVASQVIAQPLSAEEAREGPEDVVPLSRLAPGEVGAVRSFLAGRGLVARCLALGFTPGVDVQMVQNVGQGPVIVLVRDTRVALGRGQAQKILVTRKGGTRAESR